MRGRHRERRKKRKEKQRAAVTARWNLKGPGMAAPVLKGRRRYVNPLGAKLDDALGASPMTRSARAR
ncbi:hypothetical protein WME76_15340 [Sorangium sp. So ce119]|uniref:hypothetical protein n=1 Tax=Sorangium sp. So ce119 TaxID=3133279 RepID=UPI003F6202EB